MKKKNETQIKVAVHECADKDKIKENITKATINLIKYTIKNNL